MDVGLNCELEGLNRVSLDIYNLPQVDLKLDLETACVWLT